MDPTTLTDPAVINEAETIQQIETAVEAGDADALRTALEEFSDADARHIFFSLDAGEQSALLAAMSAQDAAEMLEPFRQ